jgi:hypothetical protein
MPIFIGIDFLQEGVAGLAHDTPPDRLALCHRHVADSGLHRAGADRRSDKLVAKASAYSRYPSQRCCTRSIVSSVCSAARTLSTTGSTSSACSAAAFERVSTASAVKSWTAI